MFDWIKLPSTSSSSKDCLDVPRNPVFFSNKRKEKLTSSLSSIADLETPMNLDPKGSFSIAKESILLNKTKQFAKKIISMFQRKSKDIASVDKEKNRSTISLLDKPTDESTNSEPETIFLHEKEMKKGKRRYRDTVGNILLLERKKKLFKRKPLDDYAKRKLQISRDSGWEGASSSSSSSLSSLVNEGAGFSTSSPIAKENLKKKQPRISLRAENSRVTVRRKRVRFIHTVSTRSSVKISKSEQETSQQMNDKLHSSSDSSNYASRNSFNSNNFANDKSPSMADILDKLRGLKFARSLDCLTHLSVNVKSCEECAINCDALTNQEKNRANGFFGKIFSRKTKHFEELKLAKRSNSVSCISRDVKCSLKNAERTVTEVTSSARSDPRKSDEMKNVRDACSIEFLERYRLATENFNRKTKLLISKSTDKLLDHNSFPCSNEVIELDSFNDSVCTSSQNTSPGYFLNEALNKDEEKPAEGIKIQELSLHFDCEQEGNENRSFDSFNSSYVITMYV